MADYEDNIDQELERMIHPEGDTLSDDETEAQRNLLAAKEVVYAQRQSLSKATRREGDAKTKGRANNNARIIFMLLSAAAILLAAFFIAKPYFSDKGQLALSKKALPKGMVYKADKADSVVMLTAADGSKYSVPKNTIDEIDATQLQQTSKTMTVTIPKGKSYRINLADGSSVYMYADSRLTFPTEFVGGKREVELVGKAYFDVEHDDSKPFIVHTPYVNTRVLGTQFFIEADDGYDTKVTLISGKVQVATAKEQKLLSPGQQSTVGGNGAMTINNVDLDHYTYWKDGFLYYDNTDLRDVLCDIGREYNCNIIFHNESVLHYKIHFVAERSRSIGEIANMLNQLGSFKITLKGDSLVVEK